MRIDYIRTETGIQLFNETLEEIRQLPENNTFYIRLKAIEQKNLTNQIPDKPFCYDDVTDYALEQAEKLIIDYNNDKEIQAINESNKIIVIDALMGSGKSTYIIDEIINKQILHIDESIKVLTDCGVYSDKDLKKYSVATTNFICIVPLLDEIERYKSQINNTEIFEPEKSKGNGSKRDHLKELIKQRKNIVTTHQLINTIDEEILELLKVLDYTLIIDEEFHVVEPYKKISSKGLELLYANKLLSKDDKGFLIWNPKDDDREFEYDETKRLCNFHCLMECQSDNKKALVIWNFPYLFFKYFKKIYIATYLWNGSIQKAYFDLHNIHYQHKTLLNGKLVDYNQSLEADRRNNLKKLITIYDGKYNSIGNPVIGNKGRPSHPLSDNWYKKQYKEYSNDIIKKSEAKKEDKEYNATNLLKELQNYLYNIFHNEFKADQKSIMWTCFKGNKGDNPQKDKFRLALSGKGYTKSFVPCNAKGTNIYCQRYNLAYLIDMVCNPIVIRFFEKHNISIDEDLYSLSLMLQWIWRSRIRNSEKINLYVPSWRMRKLLNDWLDNKI